MNADLSLIENIDNQEKNLKLDPEYNFQEFCPEKETKSLETAVYNYTHSSENFKIRYLQEYMFIKFDTKSWSVDKAMGNLSVYMNNLDNEMQAKLACMLTMQNGHSIEYLQSLNLSNETYLRALHLVFEATTDLGLYSQILEWLKDVKNNKLQLDVEHKNATMLWLLKQSLKLDKIDGVVKLFLTDKEVESNFVYAIIENLLYRPPPCEFKVLELYRQMRNRKIDKMTHSLIIRAYARQGKIKESISLLGELINAHCIPDEIVFNTLLDGCSKCELMREIEIVTNMMLRCGIAPGTVSYNSIIDGYVRCKEFWKAWDCYQEMLDKDLKPDNFTYSSLIKGVVNKDQRREFAKITKMFEGIKSLNITPDEILYNCMIDACVATYNFEQAAKYFKEMKQHHNITPDLITYNTLIKGAALNLDFHLGIQLMNEIKARKDLSMNAITYNTLIDLFVRVNHMDHVYQLISDMKQSNLQPDSFTYSTLMKGIKKNTKRMNRDKTIIECFSYVQELVDRNVDIDDVLFNCLIDVCIHFKDMDRAIEAYNHMVANKIYPKTITFGILIKGYGMNGQLDKAFELFEKYLIDYKLGVNEVTYGTLLDCCVKCHDLPKAKMVYERMLNDKSISFNTILHTTVIKMFNLEKNLKDAMNVFDEMLKSRKSYPNNVTFNTMIDTAIKCDELALAEKYAHMMPKCGYKPDLITFSTLAKGYIRSKKTEKAYELIKEMRKFNIKPDEYFLTTLFDGCSKEANLVLVMKILQEIKNSNIRLSTNIFISLIKLHAKLDQLGEFRLVLDAMRALHVQPNGHIYGVILTHALNLPNPDIAIDCFHSMVENNIICDPYYLHMLNQYLLNHNCFDQALIVSCTCLDNNIQVDVNLLSNIVSGCRSECTDVTSQLLSRLCAQVNNQSLPMKQEAMEYLSSFQCTHRFDKTPMESRGMSRYMSNSKSTPLDKQYDSAKPGRKRAQLTNLSNTKHVDKLDLEKDI